MNTGPDLQISVEWNRVMLESAATLFLPYDTKAEYVTAKQGSKVNFDLKFLAYKHFFIIATSCQILGVLPVILLSGQNRNFELNAVDLVIQ